MDEIDKLIDEYIIKHSSRIEKLAGAQHLRIKNEIRHFFHSQHSLTNLPMSKLLGNYSNVEALASKFLSNAEPIKRSRNNISAAKVFIALILVVTFIFVIGLGFLFRSLTPFYEKDEKNGVIYLFGKRVRLEGSNSIVVRTQNLDAKTYYYSGQLSLKGVNNIKFVFQNSNVSLTSGPSKDLVYECKGTVGVRPSTKIMNNILNYELNDSGECTFTLPDGFDFGIDLLNGNLNMDGISSNFDANVTNGNINWIVHEKDKYWAKVSVLNGKTIGDLNKFDTSNPKARANIDITNGNFSTP